MLLLKKTQHQQRKPSTAGIMFVVSLTTALIFLPYLAFTGKFQMIDNTKDLFCMLGLGFVNQFTAWLLITSGLKEVRASSAGLILLLQPVLAYVWEVLFFHKAPGTAEIAGASLALVAIYSGSRVKQQAK
jgi:drug/metabolite transporter (DMT)-like permease